MKEYVQFMSPSATALKDQINKARGDMTMADFAEAIKRNSPNIKVSASTLSRACNWSGGNPISIELLQAIAAAAVPGSEVTLDSLANANGMRTKEEDADQIKRVNVFTRRREIETSCQMIIQNEIINRGFPLHQLSTLFNGRSLHGYMQQRERVFPRNYGFGVSVSGLPYSVWKFEFCIMQLSVDSAQGTVEGYVGNFIARVGSIFASDSYESEYYENEKYSFVFIDSRIYQAFLERFERSDIRINGLMTAILIDLDQQKILNETQITRVDSAVAPKFLYYPLLNDKEDVDLDSFELEDE